MRRTDYATILFRLVKGGGGNVKKLFCNSADCHVGRLAYGIVGKPKLLFRIRETPRNPLNKSFWSELLMTDLPKGRKLRPGAYQLAPVPLGFVPDWAVGVLVGLETGVVPQQLRTTPPVGPPPSADCPARTAGPAAPRSSPVPGRFRLLMQDSR